MSRPHSDGAELLSKEFQKKMLMRYKELQSHDTFTEGISSEISKYRSLIQQYFLMPIKEQEQVYIRWQNINYYVPQERKWSNILRRRLNEGGNSSDNSRNIIQNLPVDFESITPDGLLKADPHH